MVINENKCSIHIPRSIHKRKCLRTAEVYYINKFKWNKKREKKTD